MNAALFIHRLISFRSLVRSAFATVVIASLASASATAKGPNVNLDEPVLVEVQGPVEIQGAVEIVNDALKTPFIHRESRTLEANVQTAGQNIALPPGKRLVIETVTVSASVPIGQGPLTTLYMRDGEGSQIPVNLAFQSFITFSSADRYVATHAITLRVADTTQTPMIGVEFGRTIIAGTASFNFTIFGYTEDL